MGKKNRGRFFSDNFWQSSQFNQRVFAKNLDECLALAVNRFRWFGLPDTCDARYLEMQLHRAGLATIARADDQAPWVSIKATLSGDVNMYGIPTSWRAIGMNGRANFDVTGGENGEIVYYSNTRINPWNAFEIYARKLTHYERTEDVNLTHQMKPWVFIAPQEKRQELVNVLKMVEGGEPAILGDGKLLDMVNRITAIDTHVDLITEELALSKMNVYWDLLRYLGIPHLAFEKGERMIEDEARANSAPTNIMLMNCLKARRDAIKKLAKIDSAFKNVEVVFNDDYESYNFNYSRNIEQAAQDGLKAKTNDLEMLEEGEQLEVVDRNE